ncbi:transketolase [bacterium]|nr:transketolase [bacterium]
MRTTFIDTLCEVAAENENIWLLCADLGFSVLERFRDRFPDRYLNVGVAEQNMVGIAAGLAMSGKIPFLYSIANFPTLRCLEQIRNDVCYHDLPVKVVSVGGGFSYGSLGYTHHGLEDLAVMRTLPNMVVAAPGDPAETKGIVQDLAADSRPAYLRLGKANEPTIHAAPPSFSIGKSVRLSEGDDITIISTGGILAEVDQAAQQLRAQNYGVNVVSMPYLAPLDVAAIEEAAVNTRLILTVEEHGTGGLASVVAEELAVHGFSGKFRPMYVRRDRPFEVGNAAYMRRQCGLDAEAILQKAFQELEGLTVPSEHRKMAS